MVLLMRILLLVRMVLSVMRPQMRRIRVAGVYLTIVQLCRHHRYHTVMEVLPSLEGSYSDCVGGAYVEVDISMSHSQGCLSTPPRFKPMSSVMRPL